MSTLTERLRIAFADSGKNQADLARAVGVTEGAVTQWLGGGIKTLRAGNALKLSRALNVSPEWLTEGRGPMRSAMNEWLDQQMPNVSAIANGVPPPAPAAYQTALANAIRDHQVSYAFTPQDIALLEDFNLLLIVFFFS